MLVGNRSGQGEEGVYGVDPRDLCLRQAKLWRSQRNSKIFHIWQFESFEKSLRPPSGPPTSRMKNRCETCTCSPVRILKALLQRDLDRQVDAGQDVLLDFFNSSSSTTRETKFWTQMQMQDGSSTNQKQKKLMILGQVEPQTYMRIWKIDERFQS